MKNERFTTHSPEETRKVAHTLAPTLRPGAVLALHGELGSGKTCFIQGLAEALGVERSVNSPTFTLISEYHGKSARLFHIDLYRIRDAREAAALGLDEYLHGDGITAIEWAERAAELLPAATIHILMKSGSQPDEREITVSR